MTLDEIWDWQCRMFIYSAYLYEVEDNPLLEDWVYDQHCVMLVKHYDKLPAWFTARVSKGQLEAGSGSGIAFYPDDIKGAHDWRTQALKRRRQYGL